MANNYIAPSLVYFESFVLSVYSKCSTNPLTVCFYQLECSCMFHDWEFMDFLCIIRSMPPTAVGLTLVVIIMTIKCD